MGKKILNFLILFLFFSLVFQWILGEPVEPPSEDTKIIFETTKQEFAYGKTVELSIKNFTEKRLTFVTECPNEPFTVFYTSPSDRVHKSYTAPIDCETEIDPASKNLVINPGKTEILRYAFWTTSVFDELGRYRITAAFTLDDEQFEVESNEFEIVERGLFGKIWMSGIYQPIYNYLMLLVSIIPGNSLGAAIILLTLILRGFLFIPSQKAMKSQKQMAKIQPKLNHIKEKYKDDQQKVAAETMKIWKDNKVNPLNSCLPLLIQFPILIGLFYVIQQGLNPDKTFLLYSFLADFDFSNIQTNFLSILELTKPNIYVLPLVIGGLQFFQLKLSLHLNEKKKDGKDGKKKKPEGPDPQQIQKMMMYFMPVLIAVFTASLPAGVGLYWGTSTLFGIGQQILVNRSTD